MEKVKTWNEIYKTHPIRNNLTNFLPFGEDAYILFSPEQNNCPLNIEELLAKREHKGCDYIVIACDNKYALKMFAGVADERCHFFSGLEEKMQDRYAYSKTELETMLERVGVTEYQFFYPYPNYQLPLAIYSDEYQPKIGELTNNLRNFDVDRAVLFDEAKAWDQVIKDGLFTTFANSFLLVIGPKIQWKRGRVLFSKFSNDRAPGYNIRTDIIEENGEKLVLKTPVGREAVSHIESLEKWYELLSKAYPQVQFNRCVQKNDAAELEYLTGTTLDEVLIELLQQGEQQRFVHLIKEYIQIILCTENPRVLDVDMIFKNIVLSKDGSWTVLDYEWTFDQDNTDVAFAQKLSPEFVIYRSLYYFAKDNQLPEEIQDEMFSLINVSEEEKKEFHELECQFQAYVSKGHSSLGYLYGQYGGALFKFNDYMQQMEDETKLELYVLNEGKPIKNITERRLRKTGDLREIQITTEIFWDEIEVVLGHCDMIAEIQEITLDGTDMIGHTTTNGKQFYQNMYLYLNKQEDPKIRIKLPQNQGNLYVKLMIKEQGNSVSAAFATLYHYLSLKDNEATFAGKIKKVLKRGKK